MTDAQPNFLFVMTDQHRADHVGFGGNSVVRTPHLDALAARSTRFDRAIVANPICMPNRSTILTGRQPSVHGTRYNGIPLDWSAQTFVRELARAGYRTALVGKAHFQNMGVGVLPGGGLFERAGDAVSDPHPPGWDGYESQDRHREKWVEMPDDFYGFSHVDLTVNHSDLCSGHYYQWLLQNGLDPSRLVGRGNAPRTYDDWYQVYQTGLPEEFYPTSYVAMRSTEFLEKAAREETPFFLQCSFPDPHHPFTPPGRFFEMYDPEAIPLPETFQDPHQDGMPHYRRMLERRGRAPRIPVAPFSPSESQVRHAAAAEYGMISMIDEALGRVLDTLERTGLAERTVIVFTSDHGDMFGDHGMMLKAGMHYEGCIRVPLLVARPGTRAAVCRSLVGSIDLGQTLLELAGVPEFHGMQGSSLVPLLEDPTGSVRDHVVVEEDQMFDFLGNGRHLRMRSLVREDARLTLYQGHEHGELFDLARDPDEMTNLFARPEGRSLRADLSEELARRLIDYADDSPKPTHLA
jgi:arylsulfatase A-like enzyme